MNRKSPKLVRSKTVVLRITEEEQKMAQVLRVKYNFNLSSLFRNTIRDIYEKMNGERIK